MPTHTVALLLSSGHEEGASQTFLGLSYGVWQTINLALFVVLLVYLLKKPISEFFGKRKAEVAAALRKAEEDRRRAEELAAELGKKVAALEAELTEIKAQASVQAEKEEAEMEQAAEADAKRIVARAAAEMDNRVRSARNELTAYAADLAVEIAREVLAKAVTPEDRERLFREAVADLATRSAR